MKKIIKTLTSPDAALIVGIILITTGAAILHIAAGFITGGVLLTAVSIFGGGDGGEPDK